VYFYSFAITSPWRGAIPFVELESPFPNDDLYQVWLNFTKWFWGRRFLNDPTPFLHFCDYLPLKRPGPLFEETLIPLTKG
jgi:hypothetical protein